MTIKFDQEANAVYLKFSDAEIEKTREEKPGVIIDYNKKGAIAGVAIPRVSAKSENSEKYNI